MADHTYQPVRDSETGNQIAQCTTCGHRWYGKGESRKPCVRPSICSGDIPTHESFVGPSLSEPASSSPDSNPKPFAVE